MTIYLPYTWEHSLLSLAHEAISTPLERSKLHPGTAPILHHAGYGTLLKQAYTHCAVITALHSRSFHLATCLLPAKKRRAIRALYAFCRLSDNIVDHPTSDSVERLAIWRQKTCSPDPLLWASALVSQETIARTESANLVALAWADTRRRYGVPCRLIEQFLEGVERDLSQKRYSNFKELTTYAYGVASTVGLMSMHIIGYSHEDAIQYAVKLGVALQLTNILRDVDEDRCAGRVYLPADELADFRLTEADLASRQGDDRWRAFMRFQIDRNRRLYNEARPGIAMLHRDGRLAVGAASEFYCAILKDIERHDYDIFTRRAHISGVRKICRLPTIWLRYR